jgi:hypothetical protein
MFNETIDKTRKVNVEMSLEQLEFLHYVTSCLRDELANELKYYYVIKNPEKKRNDYRKCNDILVVLVKAHEKVNED